MGTAVDVKALVGVVAPKLMVVSSAFWMLDIGTPPNTVLPRGRAREQERRTDDQDDAEGFVMQLRPAFRLTQCSDCLSGMTWRIVDL